MVVVHEQIAIIRGLTTGLCTVNITCKLHFMGCVSPSQSPQAFTLIIQWRHTHSYLLLEIGYHFTACFSYITMFKVLYHSFKGGAHIYTSFIDTSVPKIIG